MTRRFGRLRPAIIVLRFAAPVLIVLFPPPARAQSQTVFDTVGVQVYREAGLVVSADLKAGVACPGDVPVADTAATFEGEVTTTNPNGITYEVEFRYTNGTEGGGALKHESLTTNISAWTITPEANETALLLSAQVTPGQPLEWGAALVANAPGPVSYRFQRRLSTVTLHDETCTFSVTSRADLEVGIADVTGALSYDPDAETATLRLHRPVTVVATVDNLGPNLASEAVVTGDVDPAFFVLDSVSVVPPAEPCELNTVDGVFSCASLTIVDSMRIEVAIAGKGIAVTTVPESFSVSAGYPNDPDLSNNDDVLLFDVVTDTVNVVVGGMVFLDLDGNGQLNTPDEQGLEGVTIYADLNANTIYDAGLDTSSVSDVDGTFVFEVPASESGVVVGGLLFGGWEWTVPADGFQTVGAGGGDVDFGTRPRNSAILGAVWEDVDGDGQVDPDEPRLEGWRVYADLNGNGALDAGEPSGVSLASGLYVIPDLSPGSYTVRQVPQAGFAQTFPADVHTVTLGDREFARGRNFSNRPESALLGSISGRVLDLDSNPDVGLNSVVIELRDSQGGLIATDTTRSVDLNGDGVVDPVTEQGHYGFEDLPKGLYTVGLQTVPTGTRVVLGTERFDVEEYTVDLESGQRVDSRHFGLTKLGVIHGTKFVERYSSVDRRNKRVPFITFEGRIEIAIEDARTGEVIVVPLFEGGYARGVPAGEYIVRETAFGGQALSEIGYLALFPKEEEGHRIVVENGEVVEADFVNAFLYSISGFKFEDRNGNGEWDPLEPLLPGWTIRVAGPGGVRETVTDERGGYVFEDLLPGFYLVAEDAASMPGFRQTHPSTPEHHIGTSDLFLRKYIFGNQRVVEVPANDVGDGEALREAIEGCNARPPADPPCRIRPGGGGKRAADSIRVVRPLPPITRPAVIDGEGTLVLDGSAAGEGAAGLVVTAGNTDILGLRVTGFSGHAIVLDDEGRNRVQDNVLTANGGDGIRVLSGTDNLLLGNIVAANGGLPIDLGGDGSTPNDLVDDDGLQNYPTLAAAVTDSGLVVEGTLLSTPDTTFVVEFFVQTDCTSSSEAEILLGKTTVFTDSLGRSIFTEVIDTTFAEPHFIAATATHAQGRTSELSPCTSIAIATDITPHTAVPVAFRLHANYPNPFNPLTTISYTVPQPSVVTLAVYDVLGRQITELASARKPAGTHVVTFDATGLPSGVYFYRLQVQDYVETRRMVVAR